jgi:hypothetical protein
MTRLLPAPVSPVKTVKPSLKGNVDILDDGEVSDGKAFQHG